MNASTPASRAWPWWVCGLLLCASLINYMDRQTLANAATRITREFQLSQEQYGNLELAFGWAFAAGSLLFGWLADRISVRRLYPAVLALWSVVGFATGLVESYSGLMLCRAALGLFEAGHWPCALKTTQRLLPSKDRTMGNSLLQSGTSIGAIITPILMTALMTPEPGSWRLPFQVIGMGGLVWIALWFRVIRPDQLAVHTSTATELAANESSASTPSASPDGGGFVRILWSRRFLAIVLLISLINTSWQVLRAWLPKFLIEGRGYPEATALYFTSFYYAATDAGCLGAGALTLWLHRRQFTVHGARVVVFLLCACLTALTTLAAQLPQGWALLGVLLLIGMGALGVFPCYYAFSQELTSRHQGMVTGVTGVFAWLVSGTAQKYFGRLIDQTQSFDLGLALGGWFPLLALVLFLALWRDPKPRT